MTDFWIGFMIVGACLFVFFLGSIPFIWDRHQRNVVEPRRAKKIDEEINGGVCKKHGEKWRQDGWNLDPELFRMGFEVRDCAVMVCGKGCWIELNPGDYSRNVERIDWSFSEDSYRAKAEKAMERKKRYRERVA